MPQTIEVVVRLTIDDEDLDVNRLEERVRAAREEAGRALLVRALEALDERALENHAGVARQRREERHPRHEAGAHQLPSLAGEGRRPERLPIGPAAGFGAA